MKCPACGSEVRVEAKFCGNCGAPIFKPSHCPGCGAPVPSGAGFCPNCGAGTASGPKPAAPERPAERSRAGGGRAGGVPSSSVAGKDGGAASSSSGRRWSRIGAVLGYGIGALFIAAGLFGGSASTAVLGLELLAGVLLAKNGWGLRSRIPVLNSDNRVVASAGWIGLLVVFLVAVGAVDSSSNLGTTRPTALESRVEVVSPGPASGLTPDGRPVRPHVALRHPDGATADVPAGRVLYSDVVDLRRLKLPNEDPRWDREGDAWQFISKGGTIIDQAVKLEIPVRDSAAGAKVVARSLMGIWIELPSEPAKLADGGNGLRVSLKSVPTPWILSVARPRSGAPKESEPARLERLYWTDRTAWVTEVRDWLTGARAELARELGRSAGRASPGLAAPEPQRAPVDLARDFMWAIDAFNAARIYVPGHLLETRTPAVDWLGLPLLPTSQYSPGRDLALDTRYGNALDLYAAGVSRLRKVRGEWLAGRDGWAKGLPNGRADLKYTPELTMDQALETALALYAPWGVELTDHLLRTGALKGMDLLVFPAYGDAYWTDVPFDAGVLSFVDEEMNRKVVGLDSLTDRYSDLPFIKKGTEKINRVLRLYSPRAVEETSLLDLFKADRTERVMRWAPVVLLAAGVAVTGPAGWVGVLTSGAVGEAGAWAIIDEFSNMLQSDYESGDHGTYLWIERMGAGKEGFLLAKEAGGKIRLPTGQILAAEEALSLKLGIAQTAYALALAYGVADEKWYVLKDVRKLTEGSQGYCINGECSRLFSGVVPPIMVLASVRGILTGQTPEDYPASFETVMSWALNLGTPDFHQALKEGHPEVDENRLAFGPSVARGLRDLAPLFAPDRPGPWPKTVLRDAPDGQAIRLVIPKQLLRQLGAKRGLGESAPLSAYDLRLDVEFPLRRSNIFKIEKESEPGTASELYSAVVLLAKGTSDRVDGLPKGFDGPQQTADGGILMRKFPARISAFGYTEAVWQGDIVFDGTEDRLIETRRDDPKGPKIRIKSVRIPGVEGPLLVSPKEVTLEGGQTRQFQASRGGVATRDVDWSVDEGSGGGRITADGLFTAPNTAGKYRVAATSRADRNEKAYASIDVQVKATTTPTRTPTRTPTPTPRPTPTPTAVAERGYWRLFEAKSEKDEQKEECYLGKITLSEGSVSTSVSLPCSEPKGGVFAASLSWSKPPQMLVPGEKVTIAVSATITANESRGYNLDSTFNVEMDRYGLGSGTGTRGRIRVSSAGVFSNPKDNYTSRTNSADVPSYGFADSRETNRMSLTVSGQGAGSWAYFYGYEWVGPR